MSNDIHEQVSEIVTTADAERIVEQARQQRLVTCQQALQQILMQYGLQLVPVVFITPQGTISARIELRQQ